ncbi:DsbA family oxidoreductase [Aquihabitans daechungensis]|uniref:DsbA family oxidoreductase n=1 Tax=Aquihabitans daechungensis TaxID=1052257 RepID=UPI003BA04BBB
MRVDVWSDVVCPWCYVGLANLGLALDEFEHADDVEVVLHSFQLDPGAPPRDEQPLEQRLAQKYGASVGQIKAQQARIVSLGAERGIDFRFDQAIGGNTFDAHRLLHLARLRGVQLELKHALGRAYFTDGEPIGEAATLRARAIGVGLDPEEVDAVLAGEAFADEVREDIDAARRIGISGVPFFVVDGRLGVSGAQPPETLRDLIEQGWLTREPAPVQVVAGADGADACGPDGCEI